MDLTTRDFHEIVREHIAQSPAFREAILKEGLHCIRSGDVAVGMSALHDYLAGSGGADVTDNFSDEEVWRSLVCDMPEETHAVVIMAVKRWLVEDRLASPEEDPPARGSRRKGNRRVPSGAGKASRRFLAKRLTAMTASDS